MYPPRGGQRFLGARTPPPPPPPLSHPRPTGTTPAVQSPPRATPSAAGRRFFAPSRDAARRAGVNDGDDGVAPQSTFVQVGCCCPISTTDPHRVSSVRSARSCLSLALQLAISLRTVLGDSIRFVSFRFFLHVYTYYIALIFSAISAVFAGRLFSAKDFTAFSRSVFG